MVKMTIDYKRVIKEKAIIIWYFGGMRGNAVHRILSAHNEVYWNPYIQKVSDEFISHPLDLTEQVASFNYSEGATINTSITNWKFAYSSYHTLAYIDNNINTLIKEWIISKSFLDKKLFLIQHPFWTSKKPYPEKYLFNLDNTPHIWVYGTLNRLTLPKRYFKPSTNPQAYNLNLDALYSTDYLTFETEYYKLINHFNLTSCLNRVRAFILLSLERDNYISKFY
jgi:hypothetical protein